MKDGTVSEVGTYRKLLKNDGPFAEFIRTYLEQEEELSSEESADEESMSLY